MLSASLGTAKIARADPVAIHSPSELAGGVALTTLGGAAALAGSVLVVMGAAFDCNFICVIDRSDALEVGVPLLIGGAVVLGGGIWLAIVGARRVRPAWSVLPYAAPHGGGFSAIVSF
ncbi:MAG TPA: hypothetical protein VGH28_13635 [Polyangiaceae bacterium]|jgi:hypothetical protein